MKNIGYFKNIIQKFTSFCRHTANFKCEARMTPSEIQKALNSVLPEDIAVKKASAAARKPKQNAALSRRRCI